MILSLILKYQQRLKRGHACRELDRLTKANRASFECQDFTRRRAAAKKGRARACQSR